MLKLTTQSKKVIFYAKRWNNQEIKLSFLDKNVFYLGLVQSLFEGTMYTFVLEWTPALTEAVGEDGRIPHGYIFASFMIAVMMGSSIFKLLSDNFNTESFMRYSEKIKIIY